MCKCSGDEIIGTHPMQTEGRTHRLIHTANHKPMSESARLSFEKTSSYKALATMTLNRDNLTNNSRV